MNIRHLSSIAATIDQTTDFVKGMACGARMLMTEYGGLICLSEEDAEALIQQYKADPPPTRRRKGRKSRKRAAAARAASKSAPA